MGGGTTTTTTPSPFDTEKGDQARLMRMFLMNNLQSGISGQSNPLKDMTLSNIMQQNKYYAGRMGINPGDARLKDAERIAGESLTKPNEDLMQTALKMYNQSNIQAAPNVKTERDLGGMDYASMAMQAAMLAALL